jgi:NADP-dependent 3-hydroxy acid dehydrogenase YdfG
VRLFFPKRTEPDFCDALPGYNKTVNNVGVSHEFPTDFVDTSPEELATIINVNVTATLRVTSLIAPSMVSRSVSPSP